MSLGHFRVLIVGGGPVGLTAACALERAGIDFLLLERRSEVVEQVGSSLVLTPAGLPALQSLGLTEEIARCSTALGRINRQDHKGRNLGASDLFIRLREVLGLAPCVISRHDLTRMLYHKLSASGQKKILVNKSLANMTVQRDSVTAECSDGTSYTATTVIGADGAHSRVRSLMRDMAIAAGSSEVNDESPFLTTFRALWVRFPRTAELDPGYVCETHGTSTATQLFVGAEDGITGVYERLPGKTRDRTRYTHADEQALIERWGHLPVTTSPRKTLRELYDTRLDSGLVSLEEGSVQHWSYGGRVVLAGDAAHKFTPSTGAGCNAGIVDVAVLVKEMRASLSRERGASATGSANVNPPEYDMSAAFARYQQRRQKQVETECAIAGRATLTATWETTTQRLLDQYVMSLGVVQKVLGSLIASQGGGSAATFDFAPVRTGTDDAVVPRQVAV